MVGRGSFSHTALSSHCQGTGHPSSRSAVCKKPLLWGPPFVRPSLPATWSVFGRKHSAREPRQTLWLGPRPTRQENLVLEKKVTSHREIHASSLMDSILRRARDSPTKGLDPVPLWSQPGVRYYINICIFIKSCIIILYEHMYVHLYLCVCTCVCSKK